MQPNQDYKQLLTEVIKKQIVILGPDITLSKARNVKGLTVANDGTVTDVAGQPQEVIQALIDQFVQLSGLIVKKTMEPLLSLSQPAPQPQAPASVNPAVPVIPPIPVASPIPQIVPTLPDVTHLQAQIDQAASQTPSTVQNPAMPTTPIPQSPYSSSQTTQPIKNPLGA